MDITKRLQELDPALVLHNEGNWLVPYDRNKAGFTSFNDAGIETETGEFLYALTRLLKPDNVLETGTHIGVGASYMGMALKDNKKGHLDTIEFLPNIHYQAVKRINDLGLSDIVTCHFGDVAKWTPNEGILYQLILLDTEPQTRFSEAVRFFGRLAVGGFVFIHDLHRGMCQGNINPDHPDMPSWPFGDIPEQIKQWVKEDKLRPFHFSTPRGLTGFYKPHPDDYKWGK